MGDVGTSREPVPVFQRRDPGPLLPETRRDHLASGSVDQRNGKRRHGKTHVPSHEQTDSVDQHRQLQEDLPAAQGEALETDPSAVRRGRPGAAGRNGGDRGSGEFRQRD